MAGPAAPQKNAGPSITRATLDNGLRVVIVRDPLAPVATVEENYLVGGNETPAGFPGTAHAQEHMAFRGCAGLTGDQIAAIYAQLGGSSNADTQQNVTQYFVTVPAQDLDVALRLDAACMSDAQDSEEEWAQGARRHRAGGVARPVQSHLQIRHPPQRGSLLRHALRPRCAGHQGILRQDHRGHAQEVLPGLVRAQQRHPGDRGRRGCGGHAGQGEAIVRADPAPPGSRRIRRSSCSR